MELFIVTIVLISICFLGLGIRIWIKGEFASTEVSSNANMKALGLTCAKEDEMRMHGQPNYRCGVACTSDCIKPAP